MVSSCMTLELWSAYKRCALQRHVACLVVAAPENLIEVDSWWSWLSPSSIYRPLRHAEALTSSYQTINLSSPHFNVDIVSS